MSGVHQGWNLLSQFCFHKTFPTEFLLSRGKDPDCQAHSCAVVLFYRVFFLSIANTPMQSADAT